MRIVVDSGCDFTEDMHKGNEIDITRVPLFLNVSGREFIDDDTFDADEYIAEMGKSQSTVKTAAPAPQHYLDNFEGDKSVFAVTLSSKLSSSFQNAVIAKEAYLDERPNKFIHIFDSLSASVGQTIVALKINEYIRKNIKENEIVDHMTAFIGDMKTFVLLDKYDNLVKNGRVNPLIAKLASALSFRPICWGVEGEIVLFDKVRGAKKALTRLADAIASEKVDFRSRLLGISHVNCLEKAMQLREEILARAPFKDVVIASAGGITSTYADVGGLVVAY